MEKENVLHNLKGVKFVFGNGFDLYCGLKTAYKDFFEAYSGKYKHLCERIEEVANRIYSNPHLKDDPWKVVFSLEREDEINCWDVFFAMIFDRMNGFLWCDVESEMLESLKGHDSANADDYRPHWENVFQYTRRESLDFHCSGSLILASFVLRKHNGSFQNREEFYYFLLGQLKEFELTFGWYITKQHVSTNQFPVAGYNGGYIANARKLLTHLCNPEEVASIDCFNYGFTPEAYFFDKCRFVNGNCLYPIFGVDSVFDPSDTRYIFTKTNRRIEWDMDITTSYDAPDYENVIVFGHSLSSHDYNYFFPILDQLEMTNFLSSKKLVIAFSVYDPKKEFEIKKDVRKAVYSLFQAYAHYCGKTDENARRLLDSLTTQGRVKTYEVPSEPQQSAVILPAVENIRYCPSIEDDIALRWNMYIEHGKKI